MLTHYTFSFSAEDNQLPLDQYSYQLYSAFLRIFPSDYVDTLHENGMNPISSYISKDESDSYLMHFSLLGKKTETQLSPYLDHPHRLYLENLHRNITVKEIKKKQIPDLDQLYDAALSHRLQEKSISLSFLTPTSFRSQKQYVIFPTTRLIMQNLIKRWNACFSDLYVIPDEDGGQSDIFSEGLQITDYDLHSVSFSLKKTSIPSFKGQIELTNSLKDSYREWGALLLEFARYSGIGIKTTFGMGGTITSAGIPSLK